MVRLKTLWLPKAGDCKGYTCVTPPTKAELAQYNAKALRESANNAGQDIPRWQRDAVHELANRILERPPDKHF